jgi:type II secretory pathway component PulM
MIRLAQALMSLSPRERGFLALMAAVALPAALWLALAEPLLDSRAQARQDLAQAEDLRAWVLARQADLAALPPPPPPGPAPLGLGALETRLAALSLPPGAAQLADAGGGAVTLRLADVAFADLMPWLERIEAEAGYHLSTLTLTASAKPAHVIADLRLEPAR